MRDEKRIKRILSKFQKLWELTPDQRFGQVFENYLLSNRSRGDGTSSELFYTEDSDYEERIDAYLEQMTKPKEMDKKTRELFKMAREGALKMRGSKKK